MGTTNEQLLKARQIIDKNIPEGERDDLSKEASLDDPVDTSNLIGLNDFQKVWEEKWEKDTPIYEEKIHKLDEKKEEVMLALEEERTKKRLEKEAKEVEEYELKQQEPSFIVGEPKLISELNPDLAEPGWIWENYLARGHITLLSALWKAGKSTLLRCMLSAIESGEEFCGQQVYPTRLLVVSEEPESDWVSKREEFNLEESQNIFVWARPIIVKPNLKQWIEFLDIVKEKAIKLQVDLIIIDTISSFWPIDNENDAAQVMKALVPLYTLTNKDMGVLLVHHFRKGGGENGQAARGSGALSGFVTNYLDFEFSDQNQYYDRLLKTKGRFETAIPKIVIRFLPDENKYQVLGQPWEVSKKARLGRIIEIFEKSTTPLCTTEVFNIWIKTPGASNENITKRSVSNYINELEKKKVLSTVESRLNGKKKTPYYVLTGAYQEQLKINYPPAIGGLPFHSKSMENDFNSLSNDNQQNEAVAEEMKGPIGTGKPIIPYELPPEEF